MKKFGLYSISRLWSRGGRVYSLYTQQVEEVWNADWGVERREAGRDVLIEVWRTGALGVERCLCGLRSLIEVLRHF